MSVRNATVSDQALTLRCVKDHERETIADIIRLVVSPILCITKARGPIPGQPPVIFNHRLPREALFGIPPTPFLLGLAIGAWSIDLKDAQPGGGIPLGAGLWTGLSLLLSAFIGGAVTARLSGVTMRSDGVYHGVVVWGITWLVFAWLTTTAMSFMLGNVFSALGSAIQATGQGLTSAASAALTKVDPKSNFNLSTSELRRQIESTLQATGKGELQPAAINKSVDQVASRAREGQSAGQVTDSALEELQQKLTALDRDAAVNVLVQKVGMTQAQAQQVVQSTIGILAPLKDKLQDVKAQSLEIGNTTLNRVGAAAGWLFLLGLLSLAVSVGGEQLER